VKKDGLTTNAGDGASQHAQSVLFPWCLVSGGGSGTGGCNDELAY
jgi:hypothetical protein